MKQLFYKYQGTGNDFILIDNRIKTFPKENIYLIEKLCNRRFGIGGDGLILLENSDISDFKMCYYNSDGLEGSLCGNGGRCTVNFAKYLKIIENETTFEAIDGLHFASIKKRIVSLQMNDVNEIKTFNGHTFVDTGSPHHVELVENLKIFDVFNNGKRIREGAAYNRGGSNINFVEQVNKNRFMIRTYERGVEDETLSCGTGATAVAIAMHKTKKTNSNNIEIEVMGGVLEVKFHVNENEYSQIFLSGPAVQVFIGTIKI
tara:strand:- start:16174 stop:16953 length:780 start_codon:yes stop_codon:yes gene_type:complete